MQEVGHSKPVLWEHPEEWGGDRGGRAVHDGETRLHQRVFMSMYRTVFWTPWERERVG